VQLHIGESRDSGFDAELVIGPAGGRTRWHRPGMTDGFSNWPIGWSMIVIAALVAVSATLV
jgi:hypothetical protein